MKLPPAPKFPDVFAAGDIIGVEATIHAHPTLSEAVHEAAGRAYGLAIHI